MSELQKYFALRLKQARGDKPQAEFADSLGIVQQTYSRYERGQVPDGETLLKIALKLGISPDEFLGWKIKWGGQESLQGESYLMEATTPYQVAKPNKKEAVQKLRSQVEKMEAQIVEIKITITELEK